MKLRFHRDTIQNEMNREISYIKLKNIVSLALYSFFVVRIAEFLNAIVGTRGTRHSSNKQMIGKVFTVTHTKHLHNDGSTANFNAQQ